MNCKPSCILVFLEFSWEVDVNWLFVIIKSYVKVNFKERNNKNNKAPVDLKQTLHKKINSKTGLIFAGTL